MRGDIVFTALAILCLTGADLGANAPKVVGKSDEAKLEDVIGNMDKLSDVLKDVEGSDKKTETASLEGYEAFEPYPHPEEFKTAALFEQFVGSPTEIFKKWKVSHARKVDDKDQMSYVGQWAIEEPTVAKGFSGDQGLVVKSPAAHHAISRKFDKILDNKNNTFVLQYEVKLQQGLQCGGAYVKLLSADADLENTEFSNETPYVIMFGPDKCGSTDKIHFILKARDSATGKMQEHHLVLPPRTRSGVTTSLYTLIIHPDQQFEIRVNGLPFHVGSLYDVEQFEPPLTVPREIDDVNDKKPEDWDDREVIPDPEQTEKPEDWDETLPMRIPDPDAKMPKDWDESLEAFIADPEASIPEYWDEAEDGEWVAPLIRNPDCAGLSGCGKWTPPTIRNPDYKGKWQQPSIPNPNYQGEWHPRQVPNPDFDSNYRPSDFSPISGVGLELWTMQADILFDNFYIGHSVEEAEWMGNATWSPKFFAESKREKEEMLKIREAAAKEDKGNKRDLKSISMMDMVNSFLENPKQVAMISYLMFWYDYNTDKVEAIKGHPFVVASIVSVVALIALLVTKVFTGVKCAIFGKPASAAVRKANLDKKAAEPASIAKSNADTEPNKSSTETSETTSSTTNTADAGAKSLRERAPKSDN